MNYSIKTRKIKLIAVENKKEIYSYIKTMASELSTVGNKVIRLHVNTLVEMDDLTKDKSITKGNAKQIIEDKLGTSIRNSGYQALSDLINVSSNVRTSFNSVIFKTIQARFYDIINNKISIPSFRKENLTIPFQFIDPIFRLNEEEYYYFNFPSTKHTKDTIGELKLYLFFGKDRSNNRIIVERILANEYTVCDSSIQVKDNEIFLLLTYKQPVNETNLDPDKVMGIDLGINRAVSFYISGEKHQPKQLQIGDKIQHERMKLYKERNSLQEGVKYSKGGHGTQKKIQALVRFKEKERNWANNIKHTISKEVINTAKQYKVGTIKMEDLTGIAMNSKDYFLKSWAFYQLQSFIEYKAKEAGIQILWVNPKDTSITCPTCGYAHKDNRSDKDKTKFSCTNVLCSDFDVVKDADINASINISRLDGKLTKGNGKAARKEKYEKLDDHANVDR